MSYQCSKSIQLLFRKSEVDLDLIQISQNKNVFGIGRNFNFDELQLIKIHVLLKLIKALFRLETL